MSEIAFRKIEQNTEIVSLHTTSEFRDVEPIASTVLKLGEAAMKFARIERKPRYSDSEHENDSEHSFMLALVATELAHTLYPTLNIGKVSQYAMVHDLVELKTDDVATLLLTPEEVALKEQTEHEALPELLLELPPYTAKLLKAYEEQEDIEARFVRAVDKTLPATVDILGDGLTMFVEDYNVTSIEQLIATHDVLCKRIASTYVEFPEIVAAQRLLCDLVEDELRDSFEKSA